MTVHILSTLNLKRMSCNAYLSAGRLSINDTDDADDSGETTVWLSVMLCLGLVKSTPLRL